jgi:hypothetical protein
VLLDRFLPEYDVSKRHSIEIPAPRERVFEALSRYDLGSSLVTRALLRLRGYGWRRRRAAEGQAASLSERLVRFGFTLLAETPGEELVFGLAGRFWRPDGGLRPVPAAEFESFTEPGFAKAAWNLRVGNLLGSGLHLPHAGSGLHLPHCELSTETRVLCFGEATRRKFLVYWRLIEPFSGAIRWSLLRGVRRRALTSSASI